MKKEINIKNIKTIQSYREVKDNKWLATLTFECTLGNATPDKLEELMKSKNVKIVYEVGNEILDEVEKRYLREVIRPFRDRVSYIKKTSMGDVERFIAISLDNGDDETYLPTFKKDEMYLGMESNRRYSLKELGL